MTLYDACEKEVAKIQKWCNVNGVTLSNMSRYMIAKHPESLSKNEQRLVRKHLKDCSSCKAKILEMQKEKVQK